MRRLLVVLAVIGLVAGCGLPSDGSPREIAAEDLPPDLFGASTTVPDPAPGRVEVDLFFIRSDGQRLERVTREVADRSPQTVLITLLAGNIPEDGDVTTAIPVGTQLVSAQLVGEVLVITLTGEIVTTIQNPQQRNAFAQLVYTAGVLRDVAGVQFVVDAQVVTLLTDTGESADPVTPFNFDSLRPEE